MEGGRLLVCLVRSDDCICSHLIQDWKRSAIARFIGHWQGDPSHRISLLLCLLACLRSCERGVARSGGAPKTHRKRHTQHCHCRLRSHTAHCKESILWPRWAANQRGRSLGAADHCTLRGASRANSSLRQHLHRRDLQSHLGSLRQSLGSRMFENRSCQEGGPGRGRHWSLQAGSLGLCQRPVCTTRSRPSQLQFWRRSVIHRCSVT